MSDIDAMLMSGDVTAPGASQILFRGVPLGKIGEEIDSLRVRVTELERERDALKAEVARLTAPKPDDPNRPVDISSETIHRLNERVAELESSLKWECDTNADDRASLLNTLHATREERDALKAEVAELKEDAGIEHDSIARIKELESQLEAMVIAMSQIKELGVGDTGVDCGRPGQDCEEKNEIADAAIAAARGES